MTVMLPPVLASFQVKPRLIDFGAMLTPQLGGPSQYVGRLGARYAVDVAIPALGVDCAARWNAARIKARTIGDTLSMVWPQPQRIGLPGAAVVNGANQAGASLAIRGLAPGQVIKPWSFFSVFANWRNYLYTTTDQAVADGAGNATLSIGPMLRWPPADAAAVNFTAPIIEGFLDGNTVEWTLEQLRWAGAAFTLTENA